MSRGVVLALLLAVAGWAFCGMVMAVGPTVMSLRATLWLHAIAAPLAFFGLAYAHRRLASEPAPVGLALLFVTVVVGLDAGLVAPVLLGSFEMFGSILGTWAPFLLIFMASLFGSRLGER